MVDWSTIGAVIGGGIGMKLLDLIGFHMRDRTQVRTELWKEIGALRQICTDQDKKIDHLEALVQELTKAHYEADSKAREYRARVIDLMEMVNDRDGELRKSTTFDSAAFERVKAET